MIDDTLLHKTALRAFAKDTTKYLSGVIELSHAIEDDDVVTAALLQVFALFVSKSFRAVVNRATP